MITATIRRTPQFDTFTRTERVRWTITVTDGRRKIVATRADAVTWCQEMGLPYGVVH